MRKLGASTSLHQRRLTLPKVRAARAKTLAKCIPLKVIPLSYRKEVEKFGRELSEILMKKGCKEGGVSL